MANGADPNLTNEDGQNALHRASSGGELEVVKFLIANGADPKLKDNNGKTAYDVAAKHNYKKLMDYLLLIEEIYPSKGIFH